MKVPTLINDSNVHYVKFIRGSISAWNRLLASPDLIDNDTLYFIYESADNVTEGKLYLGKKLISGSGSGSDIININDIGDIYIDDTALFDKQILVYNETSGQWENTSLSTIINSAVTDFTGATDLTNGIHGLVPVPQAGDQLKFLRGDGTWANINTPVFDTEVFNVNNNNVTLNGFVNATTGSIPIKTSNGLEWMSAPTGTVTRQIISMADLEAAIEAGTANDNTIYMVAIDDALDESNKYDEYMVINSKLERLGTFGEVNLSNYVTTNTFNTALNNLNFSISALSTRVSTIENNYVSKAEVGDLSNLILTSGNTTLVDQVNSLTDNLKWHELSE